MRCSAGSARVLARLGRVGFAVAAACALAIPAVASAQGAPAPPSREDLTLGQGATAESRRARLAIEGGIERGPCPLADPAFATTRVTFSTVEFAGLPGVPAAALDDTWRGYAGRELPIAALCEVRDRAATVLRERGFLAAVQIPPQRIEANGTVRMDVLAARLVEVQLRGKPGPSEALIAAFLDRLTAQPWFNTREAERQLLLLQDLPGYVVRLVLRSADGAPGEVVGDVVLEWNPVELIAGEQNLGPRATGREGAYAALTLNDLFGTGDRTTVSYYNTFDWEEQRIFRVAHELALGSDGLRLGAGAIVAHSEPDVGGAFSSDTLAGDVTLSYPLIRRQAATLIVAAGIEAVRQKLYFGGTLLSEDQLRVIRGQLDYRFVDPASLRGYGGFSLAEPRWQGALSLELRQGLGALGASKACAPAAACLPPNVPISNLLADPSAFVARIEGTFEFRPVPGLTVALSPMAQWSGGPLLSYEQMSLGNYTIGRGLDPGVVVADSALGASLEVRYGSARPRRAGALALEPFVFLDAAQGWLDDAIGAPEPRRVLSGGGGVRGRASEFADFSVLLAVPLDRAGYQTARGDVRLLFTLTTRLLPWRTR